jgi:hypothetical protein
MFTDVVSKIHKKIAAVGRKKRSNGSAPSRSHRGCGDCLLEKGDGRLGEQAAAVFFRGNFVDAEA